MTNNSSKLCYLGEDLNHHIKFWVSLFKNDSDILEQIQSTVTMMISNNDSKGTRNQILWKETEETEND